ncbi:ricin-type beta-trefoil lectin domain protein [Rhizoctonia solani]|uniref:Ricin-type beta-trefoil lectin domain protein n=1 Tax=Rhizoctonia solani TaxID=456999 RepID=A0A8H8T2H1_9AGAM|nr:ricin-type beta-trefoil lectin domain protein [Rhizoctonia solani]QRW25573.1 ricin-type beta-trefoil lectin domain protein [Rhizoctonia solani]
MSDIPFGPCYIINVQGGLAMDLDLSDPKGDHYGNGYKVWSRRLHGRENQQWLFNHKKTGGWTVKNVASHTYLGFATKQQPEHTKQLVCSVERPEYNITGNKWDGYVIRARSPDPKIVIDLANGDVKDGTTILFWFENGGQNQKWLIMPLLYREQLFNNFVHSEQAMGIIMRILNVKTGLMFDGGDPNDWLYGWTWRGHTQRHDWLIKRGKTGFLIQEHQTKKYLKITEDNWLKLSVDDGTEFLFDGDEDHGFFILLADDLNRAVELQGGSAKDGTWVQVACARRNRLVASYSSTERHPPCFDGHRLLALVLPVTCLQALLQPKTARRPSRLVVSPQGMWWLIPTHEDEQPCLPARISHTASQPFRYYIAWFVAALHNVSNMIVSMPGSTEYSQELFAFGIPMWVVHFEITEPVNS